MEGVMATFMRHCGSMFHLLVIKPLLVICKYHKVCSLKKIRQLFNNSPGETCSENSLYGINKKVCK